MTEAGAAAAAIRALKASGVFVRVAPEDFLRLLGRQADPLVVRARGAFFGRGWRYLLAYKGLVLFTKSAEPLPLPGKAELIEARQLWLPG